MSGAVVAVSRSEKHTFGKPIQDSIRLLVRLYVEGDAHLGVTVKHRSRVARDPSQPNLRQMHLIHAELHEELQMTGFAVSAGQIGGGRGNGVAKSLLSTRPLSAGSDDGGTRRDERSGLIRKTRVMSIVLGGGEVRPGDPVRVELPPAPLRVDDIELILALQSLPAALGSHHAAFRATVLAVRAARRLGPRATN